MCLGLIVAALAIVPWAGDVGRAQSKGEQQTTLTLTKTVTDAAGRKHTRMRKVTHAERKAAAERLKAKIAAAVAARGGKLTVGEQQLMTTAALAAAALASNELLVGPNGQLIPDVSGVVPNFANSPMPDFLDTTSCGPPNYCGIRKFVDSLPGLGPTGANNLGQFIPLAVPDTSTFPGADYYEIELGQYTEKMHTDLPPTTLRGYRQTNMGGQPFHYLGPLIVAQKGRPVRVKFTNNLPGGIAGDLFLPVDPTVMGAGAGPRVDDGTRMTQDGQLCAGAVKADCYTQNRATIHLHGGVTPWISDGTTHQWITPAAEATPYPNGVSVFNVPDMENPGKPPATGAAGVQTFYYTNDQSARLMFYHDHAHGITRLNVYGGEAAGYLITDATEQALLSGPLAGLGYGTPLIIQDKTFVDPRTIGYQDPTWNWGTGAALPYVDPNGRSTLVRTPVRGDLWWPHVYQPAQNPYDITGTNPMGRWVYGPWFWPPTNTIPFKEIPNPYYDCDVFGNPIPPATSCRTWQPLTIPGTPNPSITAEAFFDTPVVNGTAYPYLDVPAGPVRFRILNASHDRFWNLSFYVADQSGNLTNGFPTEVRLKAAEVAAAKDDPFGVFPTPDTQSGASPPGPSWIYIGTEGGFLPMPVIVPPQETTWVTDPTVFNAGNVDKHSLLLGPAERADVIVDFSGFAGKTLILYNDAPAAFPARDPRFDYYTDSAELRDTGGVAPVLPGYGPNTRTVMQVRVGSGSGTPFNLAALEGAFRPDAATGRPGVFQSGQDPVIIGQAAYNETYGATFPDRYPCWGVSRIQDTSICVQPVTGQDPLYVPLQPKAIHDEMGASFDSYGRMSTNLGLELPFTQVGNQNFVLQSYSDPPTELIKFSDQLVPIGDVRADGTQIWKITHNGVDTHPVHFHLFHVQLINRVGWDGIIRLPHPTELGWKDTVRISPLEDTIVALRPIAPRPDQLPWELPNSIRPLEPALPINSVLGFTNLDPQGNAVTVTNQLTNFGWEYIWHCHILSHEEHDMMRAIAFAVPPLTPELTGAVNGLFGGATVDLTWTDSLVATGFTVEKAADPDFTVGVVSTAVGKVLTYSDSIGVTTTPLYYRVFATNTVGSEVPGYPTMTRESAYSNILTFTGPAPPDASVAPAALSFADQLVGTSSSAQSVTLSNTAGAGILGISAINATGDFAQTNDCGASLAAGASCTINVVFTPTADGPRAGDLTVVSNNLAALSVSLSGTAVGRPGPPLNLTAAVVGPTTVNLAWIDNSGNETGFRVERRTLVAPVFAAVGTVGASVTTFQDAAAPDGTTLEYRVIAFNAFADSTPSNVASVTTPLAPPSNLTAAISAAPPLAVLLNWTDNSGVETGFTIQRATNATFTLGLTTFTAGPNVTTFTNNNAGLVTNVTYFYRVRADNGTPSAWSATVSIRTSVPTRPQNLAVTARTQTTLTLAWSDNSTNEGGFIVQRATNNGFSQNVVSFTVPANSISYVMNGLSPNRRYYVRVRAVNGAGTSQWSNTASAFTLP
jgi:FtsP/CotA-like multicopper oxidase with cupredoxin domain